MGEAAALEFQGRVALVTGVSHAGQVGPAVARALGEAGARLVIGARDAKALAERSAELRQLGIEVEASAGDYTLPPVAQAAVALAEQRFGGLDVVVNLAGGLTSYGPFQDTSVDQLVRELANNLVTAYCVSQAALPALRRRAGGAIVNVASIAVLLPQPQLAAYTAAKAGVVGLTRALARELRDDHIRVNAVAPAALHTTTNVVSMGPKAALVPLERLVRAVLFLASPVAAAITGHLMPVTHD